MKMFYKLALKNVRKSIKDFIIYFTTIAFGVCLFYVFNSVESQGAMLTLSERQNEMLDSVVELINVLSVFVLVILGFLILYANKFLIRRRKKEFAIYMTLGMQKSKMSLVLVIETLVIAVVALIVGLFVGIIASQGLAVLTSKLFLAPMKEFNFVFSMQALKKTIIYFFGIFLVVMVFNIVIINKCKLIELLNASRKNEKLRIKKLWVSVLLFVISIVCIGFAYYLIMENGMLNINKKFYLCLALGCIGTLLFFLSIAGFLLRVLKSSKKIYLKNLNMFVLRQVNSKITTTYLSMSIICIMLLLSIGVLACGAGVTFTVNSAVKDVTKFDVTIDQWNNRKHNRGDYKPNDVIKALKNNNLWNEEDIKAFKEVIFYEKDTTFSEILKKCSEEELKDISDLKQIDLEKLSSQCIPFIKLSDYNDMVSLYGGDKLELNNNEVAILANYDKCVNVYERFIESNNKIKIGDKEYDVKESIVKTQTFNYMIKAESGTLIVNDYVIDKSYEIVSRILNIMFNGDAKSKANEFYNKCSNIIENSDGNNEISPMYISTREEMYAQTQGMSLLCCYLAIYMGIVFIITSAAVLALQQLSESSDNIERYKLLNKIGADEKMIKKAIFKQVLIAFIAPLSLAIVHTIVGISESNKILSELGLGSTTFGVIVSAIVIVLLYGGYMMITYFGCKRMVKNIDR